MPIKLQPIRWLINHRGRVAVLWLAAGAWFAMAKWSQPTSLPQPRSSVTAVPATSRCAACHFKVAEFFVDAPHSRTLHRADKAAMREILGELNDAHPNGLHGLQLDWKQERDRNRFPMVFHKPRTLPVAVSESFGVPFPIHWLFGSGKHAHTPVSVWLNADGEVEALEHRLSWYPGHGWGETLGLSSSEQNRGAGFQPAGQAGSLSHFGLESLGKIHDPAATRECFGCHTTSLPLKDGGRDFDWGRIVPGVSCERCHVHGDRHARAMEDGSEATLFERWADLSPLESVNRCGECHRRADHFTPDELVPENDRLVRFASVGLVQSKCFLKQREWPFDGPTPSAAGARRLDCVTCHDPHRPAESDPAFYMQRCATCHDAAFGGYAPACSTQPKESNCLPCHMPKLEVQTPLKFTDHWIRRRGDGE